MKPITTMATGSYWSIEPAAAAALQADVSARWPTADVSGVRVRSDLPLDVVGDAAIVNIMGPMEKRGSVFGAFFGLTSTELVGAAVDSAVADSSIKTIVLRIDSPGGTVDGLSELGDKVFKARDSKPVIAQVDGTMASAALFVGAQASKVVAGRTDLVGSIGTKLVVWDMSKMFAEAGIEVRTFDTGDMKSAGEPGTPITDEQAAHFQGIVDFYFGDFVKAVARGRKMSVAAVKALATGEVFPAPMAKARGLIDSIGTLSQTLRDVRTDRDSAQGQRQRRQRARSMMDRATMDADFAEVEQHADQQKRQQAEQDRQDVAQALAGAGDPRGCVASRQK